MTHRHIYEVNDHKLIIDLPKEFKNKMKVIVTVDDINSNASKLQLLKEATTDLLFLSDIKEVNDDFKQIDSEDY